MDLFRAADLRYFLRNYYSDSENIRDSLMMIQV